MLLLPFLLRLHPRKQDLLLPDDLLLSCGHVIELLAHLRFFKLQLSHFLLRLSTRKLEIKQIKNGEPDKSTYLQVLLVGLTCDGDAWLCKLARAVWSERLPRILLAIAGVRLLLRAVLGCVCLARMAPRNTVLMADAG